MKGYFRKRKDKWSFTMDVGINPQTGRRIQKTLSGFPTKKEAQVACAQMIHEIEMDEYKEPTKLTVKAFFSQWLEAKKTSVSDVTYKNYDQFSRIHILPALGNLPLMKLTPMHINKLYSQLIEKKKLAPRTVKDIHVTIHNALKYAVLWGLLNKNVASLVIKPKIPRKNVKVWDLDEVKHFLNTTQDEPLHMGFLLALSTGMRQGEIFGLRWADINLEQKTLSISQTISHDGKSFKSGAKTVSGNRLINIDQGTVQELQKQHQRIQHYKKENPEFKNYDLVVCTRNGTPFIPKNILRRYYILVRNAKVPKISFHDLRHTHASLLLKQGIHPKIVSERLGHADVRITLDTYSHLLPGLQEETAEKIGEMLFG